MSGRHEKEAQMGFVRKYAKAELSLVAAVAVTWVTAAQAGPVGVAGWLAIVGSIAATIATAGLPNTVTDPAVKTAAQAISILAIGIGGLLSSHGLTTTGVVSLVIQAAALYGVHWVTNVGDAYDRQVRGARGLEAGTASGL
jgi:hypothetical protein